MILLFYAVMFFLMTKAASESENQESAATDAPTTEEPTTEAPATESPATEAPAAVEPASDAPTTELAITDKPTTNAPASDAPTAEAPTTKAPTTAALTTDASTTAEPTTTVLTTVKPTTDAATSVESTPRAPTTVATTTGSPTTVVHTTISAVDKTIGHTTVSPTAIAPTNVTLTTSKPTTSAVERERKINHCIGPRQNFFQIKKIRKGTLLLKCRPPTPYCNFQKNLCVSVIPTNFNCDGVPDGQYPHVADCRGSIICKRGRNMKHNCPMTTSYDYRSKRCISGKRKCVIPNCVNKTGSYVRHPAQRNLYVLCLAGVPSSLYTCPIGYTYTSDKYKPCRFDCPDKGVYPDLYNRKMYYQCSSTGRKLVKKMNVCPEGDFNKTSGVCGY